MRDSRQYKSKCSEVERSVEQRRNWLLQCGLSAPFAEPVLLAASLTDAVLGASVLLMRRQWIWPAQLVVVLCYTAIMRWRLPWFWMHPFGPLSKNLLVLLPMCMLRRLAGNDAATR